MTIGKSRKVSEIFNKFAKFNRGISNQLYEKQLMERMMKNKPDENKILNDFIVVNKNPKVQTLDPMKNLFYSKPGLRAQLGLTPDGKRRFKELCPRAESLKS